MALTTNQVNASFLAILARPAEGSANTWASNYASVTDAVSGIIAAQSKSNADFVTELYSSLLNRTADASGKAYWTGLLDAGQSKESVEKQFIAAIIAQGEADPYNVDFVSLRTSTFVSSLYTNILNKSGDAEGVAYWGGRLAAGLTRAELTNEFIGVLEANPTTEDGQLFTAKIAVAEKFTNTFDNFSTLIPAEKQKTALQNVVDTFANITASSSPDDFADQFNSFKAEYQDIAGQGFTRGVDNLTSEKSTALYVGTVNIADPAQGTIQGTSAAQGTDAAAGFAGSKENSITVNVDGYNKDTANTLDLDTQMAALSDIQQMVINNGSAGVKGTVSAGVTNLTIAGAAAHEVNITSDSATTVSINSAANTEVTFTGKGTATDAVKYTGKAGNDKVTVDVLGTSDFGAGNDVVSTGTIAKGATISLGNGDDTLTLTGSIAAGSNVTIDGGSNTANGGDTLVLAGNNGDFTGISSIKNIEVIKFDKEKAVHLKSDLLSGQKVALDLTDEGPNVFGNSNKATTIDFSKVSNLNPNKGSAVTFWDIIDGSKITLNSDDGINEQINLQSGNSAKFTITGLDTTDGDAIILRGTGVEGMATSAENTTSIIANNKVHFVVGSDSARFDVNVSNIKGEIKDNNAIITIDDKTSITISGDSTSGDSIVAVAAKDGLAVYKITDASASAQVTGIQLIATILDEGKIDYSHIWTEA